MDRCFNSLIKKWDQQYKVELGCVVVSFKEDRVVGGFKRYRDLMREAQLSIAGGKELVHLAKKKRDALVKLHCRQDKCKNLIQEEDIEDLNITQNKPLFTMTELVRQLMDRKLVTREMVMENCTDRKKLQEELDGQVDGWDDSLTDEDLSLMFPSEQQEREVGDQLKEKWAKQVEDLQLDLERSRKEVESLSKMEEENVVLRQKVLDQQERIRELEGQLGQLEMLKGKDFCGENEDLMREMLMDKFVLKTEQAKEAMDKMEEAWACYKKKFMDGFLFYQVFFRFMMNSGEEFVEVKGNDVDRGTGEGTSGTRRSERSRGKGGKRSIKESNVGQGMAGGVKGCNNRRMDGGEGMYQKPGRAGRGKGHVKGGKKSQQVGKNEGLKKMEDVFTLVSPFASALRGEDGSGKEKFLRMEIENLKNQIKSMKMIMMEDGQKRKELEEVVAGKETRIKELIGKVARLEEEKGEVGVRLQEKQKELDGLRGTAGRKMEILKEEKDQCRGEVEAMQMEMDRMQEEKKMLYGEVSKLRRVEVEVRRVQLEKELQKCDEEEQAEKRRKKALYGMVGKALLRLKMKKEKVGCLFIFKFLRIFG